MSQFQVAGSHKCFCFQISCFKDGQLLKTQPQTERQAAPAKSSGQKSPHEEKTTVVYRLSLQALQDSDYGNYTCEAVNAVGRSTDHYQLRGQPDQPVVVSGVQSTGQTFYLLAWQVWTPASLPILNQSILYRLRKKVWKVSVFVEKESDRREGKGRHCCLGYGIHSIPCRTIQIYHQDYLKKRMNRRTDAWQNVCLITMNDHLVHTSPNYHPPKGMFFQKLIFKSSLLLG